MQAVLRLARPVRILSKAGALALAAALLAGPGPRHEVPTRDPTPGEISAFRTKAAVRLDREFGTAIERFLFDLDDEAPGSIAARVSDEFGLPLEAARHLAVGSLISAANWQGEPDEAAALDEAQEQLERAMELAPQSLATFEEIADFYTSSRRCSSADLVRIARAWGDLRDAALRLRKILVGSSCEQPLMAALQEHPTDLALIALLAEQQREEAFAIAVRKYAVDIFVHGSIPASPDALAQIARSHIASVLSVGAARPAIEQYESLPEPLRERVWGEPAPTSVRAFPPGDQKISASERSAFQIELAAAYLVTGNADRSRALLATVSLEPRPAAEPARGSSAQDCVALLRASLGAQPRDPFDFLVRVGALESGDGEEGKGCIHSRTWTRLIARFAAQFQYPEIERYFSDQTWLGLTESSFAAQEREVGPRFRSAPIGIQRAIAWVARTVVEPDGESSPREIDADRTPVSRAILAAVPRMTKHPFVEHRLPTGLEPVLTVQREVEAEIDELKNPASRREFRREERIGDDVVRVAATQEYEPVGEVSDGGYWIQISRDRGATWEAPLYTGLRDRFPYWVRRESRLPILSGDTVRLEVAIDEVDPDTISFPPIGLAAKRQEEGLFVSAPLSEIARDTDGDGLTDLAENALLTDFANPDTDGDSVPDGEDRLPHVSSGSGDPVRSAALAPALGMMFGESLRARVISPETGANLDAEQALRHAAGVPVMLGQHATLFVVGERSDFADLDAAYPIIVLSPREFAAVHEVKSVFYPAWIALFVLDHEQKRGVLIWSASWTGGRIRLTEKDGVWKAEATSSWIT
jgi:hypothetical protein